MIVTLLSKPLMKMDALEEMFSKYSESTRKNVRRVQEIEYVIQKLQRAANLGDQFETRF